eukprot:TRINITY_DN3795_c0_g2_i1.p1 TRINITY_DN3795_c0_g2~~TRINITY_DN3795_c0_g2_i1.p1  ORF type:complete len:483 (+),score=45.63 TRINITY_DN3795_c0_g2_i1:610-2058(+)
MNRDDSSESESSDSESDEDRTANRKLSRQTKSLIDKIKAKDTRQNYTSLLYELCHKAHVKVGSNFYEEDRSHGIYKVQLKIEDMIERGVSKRKEDAKNEAAQKMLNRIINDPLLKARFIDAHVKKFEAESITLAKMSEIKTFQTSLKVLKLMKDQIFSKETKIEIRDFDETSLHEFIFDLYNRNKSDTKIYEDLRKIIETLNVTLDVDQKYQYIPVGSYCIQNIRKDKQIVDLICICKVGEFRQHPVDPNMLDMIKLMLQVDPWVKDWTHEMSKVGDRNVMEMTHKTNKYSLRIYVDLPQTDLLRADRVKFAFQHHIILSRSVSYLSINDYKIVSLATRAWRDKHGMNVLPSEVIDFIVLRSLDKVRGTNFGKLVKKVLKTISIDILDELNIEEKFEHPYTALLQSISKTDRDLIARAAYNSLVQISNGEYTNNFTVLQLGRIFILLTHFRLVYSLCFGSLSIMTFFFHDLKQIFMLSLIHI